MAGRNPYDLNKQQFLELRDVLVAYARYYEQIAERLPPGGVIRTDGYDRVRRGCVAMRNMLGKQLGFLAISAPPVVSDWDQHFKQHSDELPSEAGTTKKKAAAKETTRRHPKKKQ